MKTVTTITYSGRINRGDTITFATPMQFAMKRGILLMNLGSPDSTDVKDVKRYLDEFLMDERVIDKPWLFR